MSARHSAATSIGTTVLPAPGHCAKDEMAPRWMRFCATGIYRIAAGVLACCNICMHVATFARFAHRSMSCAHCLCTALMRIPTVALRRGQGRLLLEPAQRKAFRFHSATVYAAVAADLYIGLLNGCVFHYSGSTPPGL